jgi:hypothetical protein
MVPVITAAAPMAALRTGNDRRSMFGGSNGISGQWQEQIVILAVPSWSSPHVLFRVGDLGSPTLRRRRRR